MPTDLHRGRYSDVKGLSRSENLRPTIRAKASMDERIAGRNSVMQAQPSRKNYSVLAKPSYQSQPNIDFQPLRPSISPRQSASKAMVFCGNVYVPNSCKSTVKLVIRKYRKHYHPINASSGQYNTTQGHVPKTPNRVRKFRQRLFTEEKTHQDKRLQVLSKELTNAVKKSCLQWRSGAGQRLLKRRQQLQN